MTVNLSSCCTHFLPLLHEPCYVLRDGQNLCSDLAHRSLVIGRCLNRIGKCLSTCSLSEMIKFFVMLDVAISTPLSL